MKSLLAVVTSVACVLGFISAAQAQFYVGVHHGLSILSDSEADYDSGREEEFSFDEGFAVGAVGGYRFELSKDLFVTTEGEITYRRNGLDEVSSSSYEYHNSGGYNSLAFMANGWLSYHIGHGFAPYVGGGIGALHVQFEERYKNPEFEIDETSMALAGQIGAGLIYAITEDVSASVDYRFLIADNPEFDSDNYGPFEAEYQNHSVLLGIKYLF